MLIAPKGSHAAMASMSSQDRGKVATQPDFNEEANDPTVQHLGQEKTEAAKKPYKEFKVKRPIEFVPAQDNAAIPAPSAAGTSEGPSAAEIYLSIVLPCDDNAEKGENDIEPLCAVCNLPCGRTHVEQKTHLSTIAHQASLEHAHPPSSLDRSRKGLTYLQSYGWDPDARAGLGPEGEGIPFPIKAVEKNRREGIGMEEKKPDRSAEKQQIKKLNISQIRKAEREDRKKWRRLESQFFSHVDLEKYLGQEADI